MRIWNKINLSKRIYILLCSLVLITWAGGIILVWYTYRIDERLTRIIEKNIAAYRAAEELETALVNQKGFVSYYLLDSNPDWLRQLGTYRQIFKERLRITRDLAEDSQQKEAINRIAVEYARFIELKDRVIVYYEMGQEVAGAELHPESRELFFSILEQCEKYKESHMSMVLEVKENARMQARRLRVAAFAAVFLDCLIGVLLAVLLLKQVLVPVRKLTLEAERHEGKFRPKDEINALQQSVRGLIGDVDESHSQLAKSREHLLQAEKMALVGQLAAGMAHGIRNPFTSVKMRLFSLGRTLELTEPQTEDFDVINQEIRHIDTIIQNFLEFSRPPRFEPLAISPSEIVDAVIQLVHHRLKANDATIEVLRNQPLPAIQADPERLKEAMVNLIVNACAAMGSGGHITIREETATDASLGKAVIIHISDNGPGIPAAIQKKIFQPFFTTKEEGTGLGLSIVDRIIRDHQGRVDLFSETGKETMFSLVFPQKD